MDENRANSYTTIEQMLEAHKQCLFQTVGDSMEPLLHNRQSSVLIERATGPLCKYDIALYKRPGGAYVLHRIVLVRKDYYRICGDNRAWLEKVPKQWILGRMIGCYPDCSDRYVPIDMLQSPGYLRMWWFGFLRRFAIAAGKWAVRKAKKALQRTK